MTTYAPSLAGRTEAWRYATYRQPASLNGTRDLATLKILILSPQKTGNTWTKQLLSTIYDLPAVYVANTLDATTGTLHTYGNRWIAHQHWMPTPELIHWAHANGMIFVTTLRHPGDMLVSLYHYVRHYPDDPHAADTAALMNLDRMMRGTHAEDEKRIGKHLLWSLEDQLVERLEMSFNWLRSSQALSVRYEDLWRDPVVTLEQLTDQIIPVSRDSLERAVEACDINMMRDLSGSDRKFYRRGGVGEWKTALPPEVIDVLRSVEPYPTLSALLGYTFEPDDPLTSAPAKPRSFVNPLREVTHFDNGVPVTPILNRLYLSVSSERSARWQPVNCTGCPDSFWAWINAPADSDASSGDDRPVITNLAAYVYRIRADVQRMFPDPFGADRNRYAYWFVLHARNTYAVDRAFVLPVQTSIQTWLDAPADSDPRRNDATLAITNGAAFLYHLRPDVQGIFPDLFGRDRLPFARWFLEYGRAAFALDATIVPLTPGLSASASDAEHGISAPWSEWLAAWQLADERSAAAYEASYEALRTYLADVEHDRAHLRERLTAVVDDDRVVRAHLAAVLDDDRAVRAHLAAMTDNDRVLRKHLAAVLDDDRALREHLSRTLDYLADVEGYSANLRAYLADVEQDRTNVRDYLDAVERERAAQQAYLAAMTEDDQAVRAYLSRVLTYLADVEQECANLRMHLAAVGDDDRAVREYLTLIEHDRASIADHLEDLQREYEQVSDLAAEREQALAAIYTTTLALEATVRERGEEIEEWRRTVATLQAQLEHAERFSRRRLYQRLQGLPVSAMRGRLHRLFVAFTSRL